MEIKKSFFRNKNDFIQFFQTCFPSFADQPHVELVLQDLTLQKNFKKFDLNISVKFCVNRIFESKQQQQQSISIEESKYRPEKMFFEDVEKDQICLEFLSRGKYFATATIPLKKINSSKQTSWILRNDTDQEVGEVRVNVMVVNQGKPTLKEILNGVVQEKILKPFYENIFGADDDIDAAWEEKPLAGKFENFEFFVEICESCEDESSNIFLASSKVYENRSKIYFNGSKIGRIKNGAKSYFKIGSLTEDCVTIKLLKIDLRSTPTTTTPRRKLEFAAGDAGSSFDDEDVQPGEADLKNTKSPLDFLTTT